MSFSVKLETIIECVKMILSLHVMLRRHLLYVLSVFRCSVRAIRVWGLMENEKRSCRIRHGYHG